MNRAHRPQGVLFNGTPPGVDGYAVSFKTSGVYKGQFWPADAALKTSKTPGKKAR
jgi:hypothetical protein